MPMNTLPPPLGLAGRHYPGHCYKLPPLPAPPPLKGGRYAVPPMSVKRLVLSSPPVWERKKVRKNKFKEGVKTFFSWVAAITLVILFSWALATGFELQKRDVGIWAKDFDYRHCTGKFDTPACHERKAKENAAAYKDYGGGK